MEMFPHSSLLRGRGIAVVGAGPRIERRVKLLEEAGYLSVSKTPSGGRVRTWLALTGAGRKALKGHLTALNALIASAGPGV